METTRHSQSLLKTETESRLNAELNQIINQRFLLTTTAITVFGAFSAFMIPKVPVEAPAQAERVLVGGTIYLLMFYLLLFLWNRQLLALQHAISVYLEMKGSSEWEVDFRRFMKVRPVGFRIQANVFLLLGILSISWPIVISLSTGILLHVWMISTLAVCSLIYLVIIRVVGFRIKDSDSVRRDWSRVLRERTDVSDSGVV